MSDVFPPCLIKLCCPDLTNYDKLLQWSSRIFSSLKLNSASFEFQHRFCWTAQKKRCKRKKKLNCLNVIIDTISQFPKQYKLAYTYNQKNKKKKKKTEEQNLWSRDFGNYWQRFWSLTGIRLKTQTLGGIHKPTTTFLIIAIFVQVTKKRSFPFPQATWFLHQLFMQQ